MSWNYYGFRPYVSVAERRRKAATGNGQAGKEGEDHPARPARGPHDCPHLLGQGLVRQPGVLHGLREPPAARPDLRPQRIGGPPGHPLRRDRGDGQRVGALPGQDQHHPGSQGEVEDAFATNARARSARWSSCCAGASPTTSWASSPARKPASFPRPRRSS